MNRSRVARETLAWCGALVFPLVVAGTVHPGDRGRATVDVLASVIASALVVGLLRRRPLPALVLLLATWVFAMSTVHSWNVLFASALTTGLALAYVAATRSRAVSVSGALLTALSQVGAATFIAQGEYVIQAYGLVLLSALSAWLAGRSARERREHAEATRTQAAAQAVTAERLRIARELHDMVAHSIGIIAIQAGVGARVIESQPTEARNALGAIETTSRETLAGLRRMLSTLRGPENAPLQPSPGLVDVERLAAATAEAGVQVDVRWHGRRPPSLPPEVDLAAYRIVQEALTNVVRHADTDRAWVIIDVTDNDVSVEIVDEGKGGTGAAGFGLLGMGERVGLLHGQFSAGPGPHGGFRVRARLPILASVR